MHDQSSSLGCQLIVFLLVIFLLARSLPILFSFRLRVALRSALFLETLVLLALRKNWSHQSLDITHPSSPSLISKLSIHSANIYRIPTMCQGLCQWLGIQL